MAIRRKKETEVSKSELKKWRKLGGGPLILNNQYIKPNQVFYAFEEDIPKAFRDLVIELEQDEGEQPPVKKAVKKKEVENPFSLRHKGGGWYDIVDSDGKAINEEAMKKEKAAEYLASL